MVTNILPPFKATIKDFEFVNTGRSVNALGERTWYKVMFNGNHVRMVSDRRENHITVALDPTKPISEDDPALASLVYALSFSLLDPFYAKLIDDPNW